MGRTLRIRHHSAPRQRHHSAASNTVAVGTKADARPPRNSASVPELPSAARCLFLSVRKFVRLRAMREMAGQGRPHQWEFPQTCLRQALSPAFPPQCAGKVKGAECCRIQAPLPVHWFSLKRLPKLHRLQQYARLLRPWRHSQETRAKMAADRQSTIAMGFRRTL